MAKNKPLNAPQQQSARPASTRVKRSDSADAFLPDPEGGPARTSDDLAESFGEEFVRSALTNDDTQEDAHEEVVTEEVGGPFVITSAEEEFDNSVDPSNPPDAEPEPFPRANAGVAEKPRDI